jgi:hypothetical protein
MEAQIVGVAAFFHIDSPQAHAPQKSLASKPAFLTPSPPRNAPSPCRVAGSRELVIGIGKGSISELGGAQALPSHLAGSRRRPLGLITWQRLSGYLGQ